MWTLCTLQTLRIYAFIFAALLIGWASIITASSRKKDDYARQKAWVTALGLILPPIWFMVETFVWEKIYPNASMESFSHWQTITGQFWIAVAAGFALRWYK
jgi:hypothetical protein